MDFERNWFYWRKFTLFVGVYNFVVCGQKHKVWVLVFLVRMSGTL